MIFRYISDAFYSFFYFRIFFPQSVCERDEFVKMYVSYDSRVCVEHGKDMKFRVQ